MCRDILNTCIRNTEEAERAVQPSVVNVGSGRGQAKGVWGMIEGSELAKTIRKDDKKKVMSKSFEKHNFLLTIQQTESQTIFQAHRCKAQLDDFLSRSVSSSSSSLSVVGVDMELLSKSKSVVPDLADIIQATNDTRVLEDLLVLYDSLTSIIAQASPRPDLQLQGLGPELKASGSQSEKEITLLSRSASTNGITNGYLSRNGQDISDLDEEVPSTPKVDKGKGKAVPQLEEPERILSSNFVLVESDEEDGLPPAEMQEERSPTNR